MSLDATTTDAGVDTSQQTDTTTQTATTQSLLGGDNQATTQQQTQTAAVPEPFLKEMPGADDKEGWSSLYAKLGRPESADGYELPVPEGDTGEFAKTASQWMHEAGLNKQQAQAISSKWNEFQTAQAQAHQEAIQKQAETDMAAMKQQWGADFDANSAVVRSAVNTFAPPEFVEMLTNSGLINNPVITNMFLKIGKAIGEDKAVESPKSPSLSGEQSLANVLWPGMS